MGVRGGVGWGFPQGNHDDKNPPLLSLAAVLHLFDADSAVGLGFLHHHGDVGRAVEAVAPAGAARRILADVVHDRDKALEMPLDRPPAVYKAPHVAATLLLRLSH